MLTQCILWLKVNPRSSTSKLTFSSNRIHSKHPIAFSTEIGYTKGAHDCSIVTSEVQSGWLTLSVSLSGIGMQVVSHSAWAGVWQRDWGGAEPGERKEEVGRGSRERERLGRHIV